MNNNQLENLLKLTASKMGTTPEELKKAAANGDLSKLIGNLGAEDSAAISKVLNDKEAAQKLLDSEQARKLMQLFGNNQ